MKNFLESLGITVTREGSKEFTCDCPWCGGKKKLYVNKETGLYKCHHVECGHTGNPYIMIRELRSETDPAKIKEILGLYSIAMPDDRPVQAKPEPIIPTIKLKKSRMIAATAKEVDSFCELKGLNVNAFREVMQSPGELLWRHYQVPILYLPAYSPLNLKRTFGVVQAHLEGELIPTKAHPEGTKYPQVFGSRHAIFGLHRLGFGKAKRKPYDNILLTEGWGDCVAAVYDGYDAVAFSGGAGSKRIRDNPSWLPVFENKVVYIIMDADKGGQKALKRHCKDLYIAAKRVMICQLPYEVTPKNGKDLKDYVNERNDIADLIKDAIAFVPEPEDNIAGEGIVLLKDLNQNTIAEEYDRQYPGMHYQANDGWTIFENGQYQQVIEKATVLPKICLFANKCAAKQGKSLEPFAPSTAKTNSLLQQLRILPSVHLSEHQAAPCSLDGSLDPQYIIPVKNGLLDWSVYPFKLHPPTSNFYTYNYLPFDWLGEIVPEMLLDYMINVTQGDVEVADLLQMYAGYTLGFRGGKKQFLLLYGESDTGKSVYTDILTHLLGQHNVSTVPLVNFTDKHLMAESYGKMLNISDESEEMLKGRGVELVLKAFTGGTMFQFKKLYHDAFSAYPTAKIVVSTNHLPKFTDTSEGIWSRMLFAPFNRVFKAGVDMDRELVKKIVKTEMPGVLAWALTGARMLLKNSGEFVMPEKSKVALIEYRKDVLPAIEFLEENFDECNPDDGTLAVACKVFRNAYESWCDGRGIEPESDKALKPIMRRLSPLYERKRKRVGDERVYFYFGIKMKLESEFMKAEE